MPESGVISDYADVLAAKLSFDRSLSTCVRQEVEDHLWSAVAADPTEDQLEAQRRAVANFGDPHAIAAQFAVVSLARHTKRAGIAAVVGIAGVFVAMKIRLSWYASVQWTLPDDVKAISGTVSVIDRYAFWLSVVAGLAGLTYIASRRSRALFHPAYRKQLRRFVLLCAVATVALLVSVISDGVLTALRLYATELSARALIPILSMMAELVCAGLLVLHVRNVTQRMASTAALLGT